ncbi:MAG TPA: glycine zipper 2TM domain-containing protein, partial [Burkholderiales bacterium]
AAVSVTLFSLAGIGAITGLIPTSHSQSEQTQAAKPAEGPSRLAATAQPAEVVTTTAAAESKPADKPIVHKTVAKHAKPAEYATKSAAEPMNPVKDEAAPMIAQNAPPPGYAPPPPGYPPPPRAEPVKPLCYDCGVIESVREIEKKGEGSGLGAVAGGVAGGLLGRQTGAGHGKDVMTVLGAIGGAFAGNAVEKNVKKVKSYEIAIRFEDGSSRLITQDNPPAWRSGDKVRLVNGIITASN